MIYIFSAKKSGSLGLGAKSSPQILILPPEKLAKYSPEYGDQTYIDISSYKSGDLKKALAKLKKFNGLCWGIIDPKGEAEDPASFFFDGASDYIGLKLIKAGISKKRLSAAVSGKTSPASSAEPDANLSSPETKQAKLPAGKFPGWSAIKSGTVSPFFFLYVSIEGDSGIRTRIGEAAFTNLKSRLRVFLRQKFEAANAQLWMETEGNCLFLIPPRAALIREAVTASLKILMASPLIGIENLSFPFPIHFTIALHYGKTPYKAPGKTGNVISDSVNFIFHLGMKRAEKNRLTISDETPAEAIPEGLKDVFVEAGEYEGRSIKHSRLFSHGGIV
jgi:hypothetical protein